MASREPKEPARSGRTIRKAKRALSRLVTPRGNLLALAKSRGTDKVDHGYIEHYARYFGAIRRRVRTVLEIGIGGYANERAGGESLRMWRDWFPKSVIHGIDVEDKAWLAGPRIRVHRGSQGDVDFLERVAKEIGPLDVVIDDGSHRSEHVLTSFRTLFPHLRAGGTYVIEDLCTSYWPQFGGDPKSLDDDRFTVGALKRLLDGLQHPYIPGRAPGPFDEIIVGLHLHPMIAFIEKGVNRPIVSDFLRGEVEKARPPGR